MLSGVRKKRLSGRWKKAISNEQISTVNELFNSNKKYKFTKTMIKILYEIKDSYRNSGCFQGSRCFDAAMKLIEIGLIEQISYEGGEKYRNTKIWIPCQITLKLAKETK